jgi:polyhydroxyalkanoate synthesis regulator phasin
MSFLQTLENPLTSAIKAKDDQSNYKEDQVFAKDHFLYLVVGRKRSGKSTLALNLLDTPEKIGGLKKKFDKIWLISPTAQNDPKMKELVDELELDGQFYNEFNNEVQHEVMNRIKEFNSKWEKKKKPHHLVIYDDVMAFLPNNKKKGQYFNSFMTNQRHFKCSAMILAQRLNELNPLVRSQCDVISYFRQDNPKEDKIFSETFGVPVEVISEVTSEPHSFITASFLHDKPKLYKRFDEIVNK